MLAKKVVTVSVTMLEAGPGDVAFEGLHQCFLEAEGGPEAQPLLWSG